MEKLRGEAQKTRRIDMFVTGRPDGQSPAPQPALEAAIAGHPLSQLLRMPHTAVLSLFTGSPFSISGSSRVLMLQQSIVGIFNLSNYKIKMYCH